MFAADADLPLLKGVMKPTLTYVYGPPFDYAKQKLREFYGAATEAEARALGKEWCGIGGIVSACTLQAMGKLLRTVEKCLVAGIDPPSFVPKLHPYQQSIFDTYKTLLEEEKIKFPAPHEWCSHVKGLKADKIIFDEAFLLADDEPMFDFGWMLPKDRFVLFDSIQASEPGSIPV